MKPLFIPLKAEHYDAFASGAKQWERRLFGPRWNRETCKVGREVVLSRGYGKAHRLTGRITAVLVGPLKSIQSLGRIALCACYPKITSNTDIIEIGIGLANPHTAAK